MSQAAKQTIKADQVIKSYRKHGLAHCLTRTISHLLGLAHA